MTTYRDRHLAGEYTLGTVKTEAQDAPNTEPEPAPAQPTTQAPNLDDLTKAELLEFAKSLDVSPANNDMTKDELRAGIDAKLGR